MAGSLFFIVTPLAAKSTPENSARGYYLPPNRMKYRLAKSSVVFRVDKKLQFALTLRNPRSQSQKTVSAHRPISVMSDNRYYVKLALETWCPFAATDPSLRLHRLVHFLDEMSGDLLFAAVFQIQKELIAIASRARPQDGFSARIDQLNRRFRGVLRAHVNALNDSIGFCGIEDNLERAVELPRNFRRDVLVEVVLHLLDVDLSDVKQGRIGLRPSRQSGCGHQDHSEQFWQTRAMHSTLLKKFPGSGCGNYSVWMRMVQ